MTNYFEKSMNKLEELGVDSQQVMDNMKTFDYEAAKPVLDAMGIELTDFGNTTWGELKVKYPRYTAFAEFINTTSGAPVPADSDPIPMNDIHLSVIQTVEAAKTKEDLRSALDYLLDFMIDAVIVSFIQSGMITEDQKESTKQAALTNAADYLPPFDEICEEFLTA